MSHDRRFHPVCGGVAHESLRGQLRGARFTQGRRYRIAAPLADLCATPGGARDRQLLTGAPFRALLWQGGAVFGFHEGDGYCGWVTAAALGPDEGCTHRLVVPASHLYPAPDIKTPPRMALYMGAKLRVTGQHGALTRTAGGWVPTAHLAAQTEQAADPAAMARRFLGAPYLWGGNSWAGIDCSGLVQVAFHACGLDCPADSDLQRAMPGKAVTPGGEQGGDLAFWPGHVGLITGPDRIIHANAHHMAVVEEPLADAAVRIRATGGPDPVLLRVARSADQL